MVACIMWRCGAKAGATEMRSSHLSLQRCSDVHTSRGHFPTVTWECVRTETPFKVWACLSSSWTECLLKVWCPRGAWPKEREYLYLLVQMCNVLSAERKRKRGGWRLQYSSLHRFSGPAWGCGKCQPLIELIKPFWVSDVNMVSTTKGHCIRQLPLGGPELKVSLLCVYMHAPPRIRNLFHGQRSSTGESRGKANDGRWIKGFFCRASGFELIWINSFFCLGRGGENGERAQGRQAEVTSIRAVEGE